MNVCWETLFIEKPSLKMATSSCLLTSTSFMIIFLEMGSLKSFGVLFNPMMDSLECSAAELGTVIGMSNSIGYIIGKSLIPILYVGIVLVKEPRLII